MPKNLDRKGLPTQPGWYLVRGAWGDRENEREIEVYDHPVKELSCFAEDFGSGGTGVDDETDCHVSVQCTGLKFLQYLRAG